MLFMLDGKAQEEIFHLYFVDISVSIEHYECAAISIKCAPLPTCYQSRLIPRDFARYCQSFRKTLPGRQQTEQRFIF